MTPCRSSMQRWQTTGLDSAFGIRQADTPRRGPPRPRPLRARRPLHRPEGPHGAVCAGVLRGQPASARIPPVHFGFRTGSPRPLRRRGRRQDASGRLPWRWNGWSPAGPPTAPTPGSRSERPPVPVRSTPSPATPPGTPSPAPASSTPSAPSAPLGGHERPRQDHGPGNSGLPQGGDLRPRLHGQGMDAGGRPEGGGPGTRQPRIFRTGGRARRAGRAAGRSGGAVPAPGGGSSQPCREWTIGSHSPDSRRAAGRCSSRERGDWPGPAGSACTGRRRTERRRAAPAQRGGARAGTRTGRGGQPPGIPFC